MKEVLTHLARNRDRQKAKHNPRFSSLAPVKNHVVKVLPAQFLSLSTLVIPSPIAFNRQAGLLASGGSFNLLIHEYRA